MLRLLGDTLHTVSSERRASSWCHAMVGSTVVEAVNSWEHADERWDDLLHDVMQYVEEKMARESTKLILAWPHLSCLAG